MYIYIYIHTYIYIYIYIYTNTHTHTHTHIYIHSCLDLRLQERLIVLRVIHMDAQGLTPSGLILALYTTDSSYA